MDNQIIKKLEAARAKVAQIEAGLASARAKELASLPATYGFDSAAAFIKAVRAATGGGKPGGRRKRAVITAETKASVKSLAEAGKTGAEIAKALSISVPSVQNIKKELGLVKARKKK